MDETKIPGERKRCVHCLGNTVGYSRDDDGKYFFRCVDCGAQGPHAPSIELAAMGWDTRFRETTESLQTASKVIKQCESCGGMFSDLGYYWLPRIAYCPICGAKVAYTPLPEGVEAE